MMNSPHGLQYINGDGDKLSIQFGLYALSDGWCSSSGVWEASEVEVALLNSESGIIHGPWCRVSVTLIPSVMLLFRQHDYYGLENLLRPLLPDSPASWDLSDDADSPASWDLSDDADALASAGWGTDEDYGDYGCGDD